MVRPDAGRGRRGSISGHHLGEREELAELVAEGHIERMDASFLCGPDSEPAYCLTATRVPAEKGEDPKGAPPWN